MKWKPVIIRQSPDYICPYCGSSAGIISPGRFCGNCGKEVEESDFLSDFIYTEGVGFHVAKEAKVYDCQ